MGRRDDVRGGYRVLFDSGVRIALPFGGTYLGGKICLATDAVHREDVGDTEDVGDAEGVVAPEASLKLGVIAVPSPESGTSRDPSSGQKLL
jgi:hypothetical protein